MDATGAVHLSRPLIIDPTVRGDARAWSHPSGSFGGPFWGPFRFRGGPGPSTGSNAQGPVPGSDFPREGSTPVFRAGRHEVTRANARMSSAISPA